MSDLPVHPRCRSHPLGPFIDQEPYEQDTRLRLPRRLAAFMDGRGGLSAFEADIVRSVLRSVFAPPLPDGD
jgi:hypothetical protein